MHEHSPSGTRMLSQGKSTNTFTQHCLVQLSKMVSMRSEKPICAPSCLSEVSPTLPLKRFQYSSDWRWALSRPFQGRSSSASTFHASLLQAIDGVMSLALCPQVVSQASQNFRSSEKQATCDGCFVRQSPGGGNLCLTLHGHHHTTTTNNGNL